jgi:hypothetical protein
VQQNPTPTPVSTPTPAPVPALSEWWLAVLAFLLIGTAMAALLRKA